MAAWPGGARGALCLSFDNLGEAAELELGALPADAPLGEHLTATRVVPDLLSALGEHDLAATFFVEGLNTELYPDTLATIAAAGHELGYHAWRHEQWGELSAAEQAENLKRGLARFRSLGIEIAGLRPPGGRLGPGGVALLDEAGLSYCSPAGEGAGFDGVAIVPFQWRHVDATCLLPPLASVREEIRGSPDAIEPEAFADHLAAEIDRLVDEGGYLTVVLHLSLLDWLGWGRLGALLDRVNAAATEGSLWAPPCAEVAEHILANFEDFQGGSRLDSTSWAS